MALWTLRLQAPSTYENRASTGHLPHCSLSEPDRHRAGHPFWLQAKFLCGSFHSVQRFRTTTNPAMSGAIILNENQDTAFSQYIGSSSTKGLSAMATLLLQSQAGGGLHAPIQQSCLSAGGGQRTASPYHESQSEWRLWTWPCSRPSLVMVRRLHRQTAKEEARRLLLPHMAEHAQFCPTSNVSRKAPLPIAVSSHIQFSPGCPLLSKQAWNSCQKLALCKGQTWP